MNIFKLNIIDKCIQLFENIQGIFETSSIKFVFYSISVKLTSVDNRFNKYMNTALIPV